MALTDNATNGRILKEAYGRGRLTLTAECEVGDLLTKAGALADGDAGANKADWVALAKAASGVEIEVAKIAVIGGLTGAALGDLAYLSNTAGGYSATAGTVTQIVGQALSATDILAMPNWSGIGISNFANNIFLPSGGVLNFNDGNVTLTHSASLLNMGDDMVLGFGSVARLSWDSTDANANVLMLQLPAGGAVDVPVIVIGQSIESVDLGLYNGIVDPRIAMFGVGAVTTGPGIDFRKARGTVASPTVVTTGDDLGTIRAYGAVAAGEYVQAAEIRFDMAGTIATTRGPGTITFLTATDAAPSVLTQALIISAAQKLTAAAGMALTTGHYETVAGTLDIQDGGAVTQATSKSTGVTLSNYTGQITMHNAALAADAIVSFTLTNTVIAANDIIVLQHHSAGTVGAYVLSAQPGAGSCVINVANRTAGSLSEAIVISFAVIKAAVT